jgi:hypothetical protein
MKSALLSIGLACLAASAVVAPVVGAMQTRAERLGGGLAQLLCSLTGVVFLVLYFVVRWKERRRR